MEVRESEWKKLATKNITQYVHRGGECKGDEPQLIGGTDLLNTIGVAMGLPTSNPEHWTKRELEKALKGELVYYVEEAREAIDVVAGQIRYCCQGDSQNFVTVLPIEVYFEGRLFELPLFRATRTRSSRAYYIDNAGRCYDSFDDWYEKSKLPPGEMAYPTDLRLRLRLRGKEARVSFASAPSTRWDAQTARGLDAVAAVAGLGASAALIFVSGGLATPLVVTAVSAAGWGTSRAGYQLVDRASHGESVNPFANSESRMLWLGIAANLTSFGAMGATMRLSSLAARGREISTAFRILADVANGTNIAISGFAILNTTIFMINNHKDLTAVDILMHGASIAFWTKGVFCYKTANTIIRDAQNYAFSSIINKELTPEEATQFAKVRNRFQNDAQLLQKFHAAMEANISVKDYSQILIDGMNYYDTVSTLTPEQMSAFDGLRLYMRDDVNLISGLNRVSAHYNLNPTETLEAVLNMWQQMSASNSNDGGGIVLRGGSLVMGSAPPIKIEQLPQLSPPMIKFFGEHLSRATGNQWSGSVPVLLKLQGHGMFTVCPVTKVANFGRAVLSLNGHLQISIYTLEAMIVEDCTRVFAMIGGLPPGATSSALPADVVKLCVSQHRLRFECHRAESVAQTARLVREHPELLALVRGDLRSYEKDRLFTFTRSVELCKANAYMSKMVAFVSEMKPTSIGELVAYSEFVMTNVENETLALKQKINSGDLSLPAGVKKAIWTRDEAAARVFRDGFLRRTYVEVSEMVRANDMVGSVQLERGLSDEALVRAVRGRRVAFGSVPSAAYHVLKHPTRPLAAHVERANRTVANPAAAWRVTVGQDGDVRLLACEDGGGSCSLLERDGRVLLCTYQPKDG